MLKTEDPAGGGGSLKARQNGVARGGGGGGVAAMGETGIGNPAAADVPCTIITVVEEGEETGSESEEEDEYGDYVPDYVPNYWEDDDEVYQEFEELDMDSLSAADTRSIASDDSFYPPDDSVAAQWRSRSPSPEPEAISFFKACCNNNSIIVKIMIRQGVTEEDVRETDRNKRSGLIVACYQGYVDVVMALSQCPYMDINWQDNEGNTALITAAQAGHITISNYLLNYFPGLDIERRNCHGFTAMMKAAMQGRKDCVRSLMLNGAEVEARDYGRKMTPREWALFTGRYETVMLMDMLMAQPCAEQFCDTFSMEWPMLEERVARAMQPRSCWRRLADLLLPRCSFLLRCFSLGGHRVAPVDDGVLDHMVRATTCLRSPLIATACHTVAPGSAPCLGRRRLAVQEILRKRRLEELKRMGPERLNIYKRLFQNSRVQLIPKKQVRRASLQPQLLQDVAAGVSSLAVRRTSLLPLHMVRRSSVRPGLVVPKVRLCKAPSPSLPPERFPRSRGRGGGGVGQLQVPKWNYKAKREERRQEEESKRLLPLLRRR